MLYFAILLLSSSLLLAQTCYAKESRIIGGQVVNAGSYPFVAAIYKTTNDGMYFCGGSLISDQWILTAGQCVVDAILFNIRLGLINLNSNDENVLRLATEHYVLHPDYNPLTLENDIGLIQLRIPISFTDYIKPVDYLPTNDIGVDTLAVALGWGQTDDEISGLVDDLHWVLLVVVVNDQCRIVYGNQITDQMACAEGTYNQGICHGDTGGPLVYDHGRAKTQLGVSSFISSNGCESTDPSGFTKTYPYVSWIYNVTGM